MSDQTLLTAAKQALKTLSFLYSPHAKICSDLAAAVASAEAAPSTEPAQPEAWMVVYKGGYREAKPFQPYASPLIAETFPLYRHPQPPAQDLQVLIHARRAIHESHHALLNDGRYPGTELHEFNLSTMATLTAAIDRREGRKPVAHLTDEEINFIARPDYRNAYGAIYSTSIIPFARDLIDAWREKQK